MCSVGLEGPAALSVVCVCVCVCMYARATVSENVCERIVGFWDKLFMFSFLCFPLSMHVTFSVSLCMRSITLYYESVYTSVAPKVCLSTPYITWHLQNVFSTRFLVVVHNVHSAHRQDGPSR